MFLQLKLSSERIPQIQASFEKMTDRLKPYQYLHSQGIYSDLSLHLLGQQLWDLERDIDAIHSQLNNAQTQKLSKEVQDSPDFKAIIYMSNLKYIFTKLRIETGLLY